MQQNPYQQGQQPAPQYQQVHHVYAQPARQGNAIGLTGFIFSIAGLLTCGLTAPLGFIISLFGMGKEPRGMAIAGLVTGGILSLTCLPFGALFGVGIVVGAVGVIKENETRPTLEMLGDAAEQYKVDNGAYPADWSELLSSGLVDMSMVETNARGTPTDAWGNPLEYQLIDDEEFLIYSYGFDGLAANEDDLDYYSSDGYVTGGMTESDWESDF